MYSLVQGVRLIHYWNKENEQCLVKICMRTVNITIYHTRCACIMKKKNAVFLRNKIYSELEGRLELKAYSNIPPSQKWGCCTVHNRMHICVKQTFLMNNGGHNPGCHLSVRKHISCLLFVVCVYEYIRGIYNESHHVSYGINPPSSMQSYTCGLSCSGPGYAPVWSLGRHQGLRPLAPASLEPDWTGWLKSAVRSLRIRPDMQEREEKTKLLFVSIISLWRDPIWLLS